MRIHLWSILAGLALAGVTSSTAQADVSWSGAGWYVEATATGFDSSLVSGPYASEEACKDALPADTDDYSYICEDEETDPDAGSPPAD